MMRARRIVFVVFAMSLGLSAGCEPDTEAIKAEVQEEVRGKLGAEYGERIQSLEKRVEALELQAKGFEVVRASGDSGVGGAPREGGEPPAQPQPQPTQPQSTQPEEPAPSEPVPTPTTPPAASEVLGADSQGLVLKRLVVAPEIVSREPSNPRTSYTQADEQVHCFMEFANKDNPPRKVTVVWSANSEEFHRHTLDVGSGSRYRTHARAKISPKRYGRWSCEVQNESGERLGRAEFDVSAQ